MRLLLDTHIVLWWAAGSRELGPKAAGLIAATSSTLYVSAASWWEIVIKRATGRLNVDLAAARMALKTRGVAPLAVTLDHAEAAASLAPLHHDPFDRMLVAQATFEKMRLLTRDRKLRGYGTAVLHV